MEKLDPDMFAETDDTPFHLEGVQYGVTTAMVVYYLEDTHSMPRIVAEAVTEHIWDVWNDVAEGGGVKQGDLINSVIQGWVL